MKGKTRLKLCWDCAYYIPLLESLQQLLSIDWILEEVFTYIYIYIYIYDMYIIIIIINILIPPHTYFTYCALNCKFFVWDA